MSLFVSVFISITLFAYVFTYTGVDNYVSVYTCIDFQTNTDADIYICNMYVYACVHVFVYICLQPYLSMF